MAKFELSAFTDEYSKNFDKQIEGMLANGIKYTEIRGVDGKNISALTLDEAKEVKKKLDANGLAVWSVGSPLGKIKLTDDINAHIDLAKHVYEIANILNTPRIRVFSFFVPDTRNPAPYRNEAIDFMGRMLDAAKPYNCILCHENEKGIYGEQVDPCIDIMKTFKGGYKCIFDPANFIQSDVKTFPDAFNKLSPYIYYMHIKDCNAEKTVVPAGQGVGHIEEILRELNKRDETITLTIEPHLRVFDGLKNLEEEGNTTNIGDSYPTSESAFTAACDALKTILNKL